MFVPETLALIFLTVFLFINFLEDILETTIILLQDGVLGAHVQGHVFGKSHLETTVSETLDGIVGVVHGHTYTTIFRVVIDVPLGRLRAIGGCE
jgi:hypothetical protein